MMGVADGHGLQGHQVSNYVKVNLPKILSSLINNRPLEKLDNISSKKNSFLPNIGGKNKHEIDGLKTEEDENEEPSTTNEFWLSN